MEPTGLPQAIQNSVQKVLALPQTIPIYYYAGHGNDMCDETTHKPILRTVPDNCIYITITECGILSILDTIDNPQEIAFRSKSPITKKILQYPYIRDNKKKLAELLQVSDSSSIHIHFPGMSYVESFFQPVAYFDKEEELPVQNNEILSLLFFNSGLLEKSKMESNPNPSKPISADERETFYISKNEILQKYQDSVYPTPEVVNELLEQVFAEKYILDADDLNIFIDELIKKMKEEQLTNTYMMQQFPGIHYNVVCRGVSSSCEEGAELQRTLSGQQEQQREQKEVEELLTQKIVFPKQLQNNIKQFRKAQYSRKRNNKKKITQKKRKV